MFHKVRWVIAQEDHNLLVQFSEGVQKQYDVKPLLAKEMFKPLTDEAFFMQVKTDAGGYGIIWNDNIDISCNELYESGITIRSPFDDLMAFGDATSIWDLHESTLRKAIEYGKLRVGSDVCKFGKQWVITREAMLREYGEPPAAVV